MVSEIRGHFDAQGTPWIQLQTPYGIPLSLIVDTRFNGELVLPERILDALGLTPRGRVRVELADGSRVYTDIYECKVFWFEQERVVSVFSTAAEEGLFGTQMLRGCTLLLDLEASLVVLAQKT